MRRTTRNLALALGILTIGLVGSALADGLHRSNNNAVKPNASGFAVPEPTTIALLAATTLGGALGVTLKRRQNRRRDD